MNPPATPLPEHGERPASRAVIVGSRGRMGAMLLRRALDAGMAASGTDLPFGEDALREACAGAELAVFCVPVSVLGRTLELVGPHLPPDAVVADITSVKELPMRLMERGWPGASVGTHPLFGPKSDPEADRPVAVMPGARAGERHLAMTEAFFSGLGFRVFRTTPEEHDAAMAVIQNLNFVTNLAYFAMLAGHDELEPFLTPSFRRRQEAARKMLTEDAPMFAGLFEANSHSKEAVRRYGRILNAAAAGDVDLLCRRAIQWWPDASLPEHERS